MEKISIQNLEFQRHVYCPDCGHIFWGEDSDAICGIEEQVSDMAGDDLEVCIGCKKCGAVFRVTLLAGLSPIKMKIHSEDKI